jgi:pimeloyl-ACP methyl ester carboxylesterase
MIKRRLLFLPGAGTDPEFWKPLGNLLPDTWEKIYFAWPGLGHQKSSPRVKCFDDLVTLVEESLSDSPVDLLAQSMGGHIAVRILLKYPEKIRRVVFAVSGAGLVLSKFGGIDWKVDYQKEYPEAASWFINEITDFTNELPKIAHPVLLFCGDADPICPVAVGERLLQLFPNSKLEIVHGGDHSFVRDHPDKIINAIKFHLM